MRYYLLIFSWLLLIQQPLADNLSTADNLGLLNIRSQSLLQQVRFGLHHREPGILESGKAQLYLGQTWKNVWMKREGVYRIDGEIHEFPFRLAYGLSDHWQLSIELPVRYVDGGIMDRAIESFHGLLGISNNNRDRYERGAFVFEINNGGWTSANRGQVGWNLGNAVLGLSAGPLIPSDRVQSSASVQVKIPTTTRTKFFGHQSIDLGVTLSVASKYKNLFWYVSPGVVYYGDGEMIGVPLRRWHYSSQLGIEYHRPGSKHSWVSQLIAESGMARSFSQFSYGTYELMFGYKRQLNQSLILELGILENLFYFDNSPDFGLHFGLTHLM
ncbi:MAG: DUF3187 family protein [bacterium]|nr:DUF3187 family protein [bacterium]